MGAPRDSGKRPARSGGNSRTSGRKAAFGPVTTGAERPRKASIQPTTTDTDRPPAARTRASRGRSTVLGAALGVALGAGVLGAITFASGLGSERAAPPGPAVAGEPAPAELAALPAPPVVVDDSREPVAPEPDPPQEPAPQAAWPDEDWNGPLLGAMAQATPIYPTARFSQNRLGYIRRGGTVPVKDTPPLKTSSCKQGFYQLVAGGYVCGKYSTLDVNDARVKLTLKRPDTEGLLPYQYAYNKAHGTPLYHTAPTREEMLRVEPYLDAAREKAKREAEAAKKRAAEESPPEPEPAMADADKPTPSDDGPPRFLTPDGGLALPPAATSASATPAPAPSASATSLPRPAASAAPSSLAPLATAAASAEPPAVPWWLAEDRPNVTLAELEEGEGALAKRMVKGFFIAVDRTFSWNDRMWYRTTGGLIAPADRMIIPKTPELKGIELTDGVTQAGFIRNQTAYKYVFDAKGNPKTDGRIARFTAIGLTGETRLHKKERFRETNLGWWMKESQGTYTEPGKRPEDIASDEKWVDVNLSRRTLVLFEGDTPVFAAVVSPGKRSANKRRDHRTKVGRWRVREKHVTATMDGDGAAGDLPYSIEDVPYVIYYDGSYALHAAFWHHNFGQEQSHGCVNLSPADAKRVFNWVEPRLPVGWHGVWSSSKRPGTMVVVHE